MQMSLGALGGGLLKARELREWSWKRCRNGNASNRAGVVELVLIAAMEVGGQGKEIGRAHV